MAKDARMLHITITKSLQVDRLPLPARLLFSWMISCADDNGRLKGDPRYVKGCVVPLTNWSPGNVKKYLELMKDEGLIYYWQENNEWFIEFVKWDKYQHIRADRFKPSDLPSFHKKSDNQVPTNPQPDDNQRDAETNISEVNSSEVNKSESSDTEIIADENLPYKEESPKVGFVDPAVGGNSKRGFVALEIFKRMEPGNLKAMGNYVKWVKVIPVNLMFQWASEIEQDSTIRNRGAVFNAKVKEYLDKRSPGT